MTYLKFVTSTYYYAQTQFNIKICLIDASSFKSQNYTYQTRIGG